MPVAQGEIFAFEGEEKIQSGYLESIEYRGNPQEITYETEEFSAVCPFSGLPDLARVIIRYVPGKKLIELKSLKYYFVSFRNVGIYQEAVTDRIYNDVYRCLEPESLIVKTIYNIRGGILATCVMDSAVVQVKKKKKPRAGKP